MRRARWLFPSFFALAMSCATVAERPSVSGADRPPNDIPPPSSGELGYKEAVALGTQFVAEQGYGDTQLEGAEQIHPNVWRVRFGKGPDGVLHLYFDGMNKSIIKAEEIQGVRGRPVTVPLIPTPQKP